MNLSEKWLLIPSYPWRIIPQRDHAIKIFYYSVVELVGELNNPKRFKKANEFESEPIELYYKWDLKY